MLPDEVARSTGQRRQAWMRRWMWAAGIVVFVGIGLCGSVWFLEREDMTQVHLTNIGNESIVDVVLHVTGRSYSVDSIPAGKTVVVRVAAASDSHLEVGIGSPLTGAQERIDVGGYFGPSITAEYFIDLDTTGVRASRFRYR